MDYLGRAYVRDLMMYAEASRMAQVSADDFGSWSRDMSQIVTARPKER